MRVVSLLPSATEIVCALGARDDLVGRSHECDYPTGLEHVPVLTRARVRARSGSRAIDSAVRDVLKEALAVYDIDVERLRDAKPDVIVTQDLCDVCAVSLDDVRAAVARLAREDVAIVNLHPKRLDDIWANVSSVARALDRAEQGHRLVAELRGRVEAIRRRAEAVRKEPTVLAIEWIDPVMIAGMWMPELVALAGGRMLVTKAGDHAPTLTKDQLATLDPDIVLIKPCGFDLKKTLAELTTLRRTLPWDTWRAVREGGVYAADGNAFFNRPGPRIVESLEILAACLHGNVFADLAEKHRRTIAQITRDLRAENP
jgi:iron complex transport system substrate-binding protein